MNWKTRGLFWFSVIYICALTVAFLGLGVPILAVLFALSSLAGFFIAKHRETLRRTEYSVEKPDQVNN